MIRRPRIDGWFERSAGTQLRLLVAPLGFGKTTALGQRAADASAAGFCTMPPGASPERMHLEIARALGWDTPPSAYAELVEWLYAALPGGLVVDGVDRAAAETIDELVALVADAPARVELTYAVQSRERIPIGELQARGFAALLDAVALAFDAAEIRALCAAHGVAAPADEIGRLRRMTDGWPVAVGCVVRDAAARGTGLAGAYDHWLKAQGRHFTSLVGSELGRADGCTREAFARLFRAPADALADDLAQLEMAGLFVIHEDGLDRPLRVVADLPLPHSLDRIVHGIGEKPLVVRLFGRFEATVHGRPIIWNRKRDAQIFKFLLLKRDSWSTRGELIETFWPDSDPQLAAQSLRTACSNIRKAIAVVAGNEAATALFASRDRIGINLAHADVDVQQFMAHVEDGEAELDRGHKREALVRFRAAERAYAGELLAGDYPETWARAAANAFEERYVAVCARLAALGTEIGEAERVRANAERGGVSRLTTYDRGRRIQSR
ncbi:MAG: BTAD domain-containing putative transcriptional regulator [Vulcanimicrobiaceae bacterium]